MYFLTFLGYCLTNTKLLNQAAYRAYFTHSFLLPPLFFKSLSCDDAADFSFLIVIILAMVFFISFILPGFFGTVPIATCEFDFISSFLSSADLLSSSASFIDLSSFAFIFLFPFSLWLFFLFGRLFLSLQIF